VSSAAPPLLAVRDLRVSLPRDGRFHPAVDGVSFELARGEALAVAGESGCGKTLLARALVGLSPPGSRTSGSVAYDGRDVAGAPEREWERIRGGTAGFLFQEPATALDPVQTVGDQVVEAIRLHAPQSRAAARRAATARLREVGFPDPRRVASEYPHRLSGGQRQRAMLAAALAADPRLLIADEPTSALDATVAAEVLALLSRLRRERGLALLLVSHDLRVVARETDRTLVLYAGRVVEEGPTAEIFASPRHPYTRGLLACVPRLASGGGGGRLFAAIPGAVPDLYERRAEGCAFAPRCAERFAPCDAETPALFPAEGARVRCFLYDAARGKSAP
jgi:peptide/nickel transport system ATP-binding protein